jgi:hypothetical protein
MSLRRLFVLVVLLVLAMAAAAVLVTAGYHRPPEGCLDPPDCSSVAIPN